MCAATSLTALLFGALLLAAIVFYNFVLKNVPLIGVLNMGICRGLSLLLGAACAGTVSRIAIIAACLMTVYVAAVTQLAGFETKSTTPLAMKLLPLCALVAGGVVFCSDKNNEVNFVFYASYLLAIAAGASPTVAILRNANAPLPQLIGAFIRVLLPMQAALCMALKTVTPASLAAALVLLALWPISRLVGRRFYAS